MQFIQRRSAGLSEFGARTITNRLVLASCCVLLIGACTPYPIYTSAQGGEPDYAEQSSDSDDAARSKRAARRDAELVTTTDEIAPSTVDPRVFSRVVESYLGIPYKMGGRDSKGIDCSNLASALHQDYSGRRLTPSTRALFKLPFEVPRQSLEVGDLVFFSFGGRTPSHVGVYMGDDRFVHASESQGVIYSSLGTPYYRDAYRGARRIM
jgi:cell wall-associated NlpC family hydrolase